MTRISLTITKIKSINKSTYWVKGLFDKEPREMSIIKTETKKAIAFDPRLIYPIDPGWSSFRVIEHKEA